jgi:hypothetical protein
MPLSVVTALLELGADPLQLCSSEHEILGERLGQPSSTCLGLATEQGAHELEALMVNKLLPATTETLDPVKAAELLNSAIKSDYVTLFEHLLPRLGDQADTLIAAAFKNHGQHIGPALARQLLVRHTAIQFVVSLIDKLGTAMPNEAVARNVKARILARFMGAEADNGSVVARVTPSCDTILKGLSRAAENGDTRALAAVREALLQPQTLVDAAAKLLATTLRPSVENTKDFLASFALTDATMADITLGHILLGASCRTHPALGENAARIAGETFNTLLTHAAENRCAQSMLALLPLSQAFVTVPTPTPRPRDAKLHIENPQDLLKKVAHFPTKDRNAVAKRLCRYIALDTAAPVTIGTLRGQIGQILPEVREAAGDLLFSGILTTVCATGTGAALYYVAKKSNDLKLWNWYSDAIEKYYDLPYYDRYSVPHPIVAYPEKARAAMDARPGYDDLSMSEQVGLLAGAAGAGLVLTGLSSRSLYRNAQIMLESRKVDSYRKLLDEELAPPPPA